MSEEMRKEIPLPKSMEGRKKAILVLSDGTCFSGFAMGAAGSVVGEVVFNTGMTGYQEVLTDPSYSGQVVTFTAPHIGNYGVNKEDGESQGIQAVGAIVRDVARRPSNHRATLGFEEWLVEEGVVGICEIDTRALTRRLRDGGVTMGVILHEAGPEDAEKALSLLEDHPAYGEVNFVDRVACTEPTEVLAGPQGPWQGELELIPRDLTKTVESPHVAVVDFGVKFNILRHLLARGINLTLVPRTISDEQLERLAPQGILFSNGPGDPAQMVDSFERIRQLSAQYPTMGICLGHQLLASAFGGMTYKLAYGHRGPNQPVQLFKDGSVAITSQNHGYSVERDSFPDCLEVTEINLNDQTVAGFRHRTLPIVAVQYHPEAGPGPGDAAGFFDEFVDMIQ